jgi:NAD(P)H-dependent flavin oxidoreductase YrpB (nitropropane dioxygenase family)
MGIRISSWQLAREVARAGELGVVSATCIDTVMVRELQNGTGGEAFRLAEMNYVRRSLLLPLFMCHCRR